MAQEVVGRYVELSGGSAAEREAAVRAVTAALDDIAGAPGEPLEIAGAPHPSGVDVTLQCGRRALVVHHPLPAARR
jgi:hypothetical protein